MNTQPELRRALSPELVAVVLVVLIAAGGLVAVVSGSSASSVSSTPTPPTASVGSVEATATAATPTATATIAIPTLPITSAPPTPTPPPTTAPSASTPTWAPAARALIDADLRVIEWRETLRSELAQRPKTSEGLARLLRSTNLAIQTASSALDTLDAADAPQAIVGTLRAAHRSALDTSVRTLQIALQDVSAYSRGATDVIAALEPLEGALDVLAASAGLPDRIPPLPSSPIGSAAPAP